MATPSLSLTTATQVSPKLALNFTTGSLDDRVTFTRSGDTATVVNSSGLIINALENTPRFDHNPLTLACKGLLIEESKQNLVSYSIDLSNIGWLKARVSVSANTFVSPDGTTNADKFFETATSGTHFIESPNSTTVGGQYTGSIYVKAEGRTIIEFYLIDSVGIVSGTVSSVNLATGAIISGTNCTITPFNNGYYRITVTGSPAIGTVKLRVLLKLNTTTISYLGDGVSGVVGWGMQIELGGLASSFIFTEDTAVTRNADVATMTSTNFSDWFNAPKGTFKVDFTSNASGNRPTIAVDDNTANEAMIVKTQGNAPTFEVIDGGSPQASVTAGTVTANTPAFAYVSYDVDFFGIARPTARQVDTSGTVPTVDRLRIGADQAGNYFNNTIQQIQFWP